MRRIALAMLALGLFSLPALANDYRFTVANNANQDIVGIEVSEDGESWAPFNIGDGIPSGEASELVWAESTNDSNCEWMFRATFAGGETLSSDFVDFCQDDVVISFSFPD